MCVIFSSIHCNHDYPHDQHLISIQVLMFVCAVKVGSYSERNFNPSLILSSWIKRFLRYLSFTRKAFLIHSLLDCIKRARRRKFLIGLVKYIKVRSYSTASVLRYSSIADYLPQLHETHLRCTSSYNKCSTTMQESVQRLHLQLTATQMQWCKNVPLIFD